MAIASVTVTVTVTALADRGRLKSVLRRDAKSRTPTGFAGQRASNVPSWREAVCSRNESDGMEGHSFLTVNFMGERSIPMRMAECTRHRRTCPFATAGTLAEPPSSSLKVEQFCYSQRQLI